MPTVTKQHIADALLETDAEIAIGAAWRRRCLWFTLFVSAISLASCARVIHPTEVHPGFQVDILPDVVVAHRAKDPSGLETATVQFNAGYGWRSDDGQAFSMTLLVPYYPQMRASVVFGSLLDLYYQFPVEPINVGMGLAAGIVPQLYVQTGRSLRLSSGTALSFDLALKWVMTYGGVERHGIAPSVLTTIAGKWWRAGLWAEYDWFPATLNFDLCVQNCSHPTKYIVHGYLYGGALLGVMF